MILLRSSYNIILNLKMYTTFVTALLAATVAADLVEGPTVKDGDKAVMTVAMAAEYNATGEGAERTLALGA